MSLNKIALQFSKKLAAAWQNTYRKLIDLTAAAKSLPIDPYGEKDASVVSALNDISHAILSAANKAWQSGINASELEYYVNKAKTKATLVLGLGSELDEGTRGELASFYDKLTQFTPIDIPAQKPSTPIVQPENNFDKFKEIAEKPLPQSVMPEQEVTMPKGSDEAIQRALHMTHPTAEETDFPSYKL